MFRCLSTALLCLGRFLLLLSVVVGLPYTNVHLAHLSRETPFGCRRSTGPLISVVRCEDLFYHLSFCHHNLLSFRKKMSVKSFYKQVLSDIFVASAAMLRVRRCTLGAALGVGCLGLCIYWQFGKGSFLYRSQCGIRDIDLSVSCFIPQYWYEQCCAPVGYRKHNWPTGQK